MRRVIFGFSAYFRGMGTWLSDGTMLRLSIAPFFIDLICLVAASWLALSRTSAVLSHFVRRPETGISLFWYAPLFLITAAGLLLVAILVALAIAGLIAFPFNALLAERMLALRGAMPKDGPTLRDRLRGSLRNTGAMFRRMIALILAGAVMLVVAWIPGLGFVTLAGSAILLAVDRLDYGFDLFHWSFGERVRFVGRHFPEIAGFAAGLAFATAIPVFNALLLPGSVAAAASLTADLAQRSEIHLDAQGLQD